MGGDPTTPAPTRRGGHSWREHSVEFKTKFAALWGDATLSCAAIGEQLGVSVNAVVGLRRRMGLPSRGSPIRRADGERPARQAPGVPAPPRQRRPRRDAREREMSQKGHTQPQRLAPPTQVFGSCQFPLGTARPWRFCDAPLEQRLAVYCAAHAKRCFAGLPRKTQPAELRRYP